MSSIDPHKNIFYSYRGPNREKSEAQLENNLTKAFINLLDPQNLSTSVGKRPSRISKSLFGNKGNLIRKPLGKLVQVGLQPNLSYSRPDALLIFENGTIGIESKISAKIQNSQINEHLKGLQDYGNARLIVLAPSSQIETFKISNEKVTMVSWEKLYSKIEEYQAKIKTHNKESFLVQQFLEYLRLLGMVNYFVKEDFKSIENDADTSYLKSKLRKFAELLQKRNDTLKNLELPKKENKELWTIITKAKETKNSPRYVHFTLWLHEYGIRIFLNSQKRDCPKRLAKRLLEDTIFEEFWEKIRDLQRQDTKEVSYEIILQSQRKFGQGDKNYEPIFETRMPLSDLKRQSSRYRKMHDDSEEKRKIILREMLRQIQSSQNLPRETYKPYLFFRISCDVSTSVLLEGDNLDQQAKIFLEKSKKLIQLYEFLESVVGD